MDLGVIICDTREQHPFWAPGSHDEHGYQFTVRRCALLEPEA